ncbi:CNNM domain-containing protein [Haloferula sp.]|uniref:CNNM domain-containing protein n=1 Tax=Haloferula sp. TaxID=2497595 RepID=UPI003C734B75
MALLITYVLIALGFSFLCSLLEATLLTITPTTVQTAKQKGAKWAIAMEKLKSDIDRPLSAILTLNTVAHTMGAAGAGAQYAKIYGNGTEAVFAGVLTFAILIFTEIIPKTLGARYSSFFAPGTAWVLPKLQLVLYPLVWLCRQVTRLITFGKANEKPMHREELLAVAHLGEQEGVLKSEEGAIVRNILQLGEVRVSDIMTPRPVIYMLPQSMSLQDFAKEIDGKPFSRIPVYGSNRDDVHGFVLKSDGLQACLKDGTASLESVSRPLEAVPQQIGVDRLFRRFLDEGAHVLLVHDEYGTSVGLVTLEDVLETIVGVEIVDEQDKVADLQVLARKLWAERAGRMGIPLEGMDSGEK